MPPNFTASYLLQVGQCFWGTAKDEAEAKLEQLTEEAKQELE
jgi:hypothetical protein